VEEKIKRVAVLVTLNVVLITLSFVFFNFFSITPKSVITYPLTFFEKFILTSASLGVREAVITSFYSLFILILPFIPISVAFSIMAFYGAVFGEDKKMGFISCFIPSLAGIIILGPSISSILFSLGLMLCGTFSTSIAVMYEKELKKWRKYRIGSKTVSKLFIFINLILLLTLTINVVLEMDSYKNTYKEEMEGIVLSIIPDMEMVNASSIKDFDLLPKTQQEKINEDYTKMSEEQEQIIKSGVIEMIGSEKMTSLIEFSIFLMPFMVFAMMELIRTVILSPLAGIVTKISLMGNRIKFR